MYNINLFHIVIALFIQNESRRKDICLLEKNILGQFREFIKRE